MLAMRTLHTAYRVLDIGRSLDFYGALGYAEIGRVQTGDGSTLVMLQLTDDAAVSLELVHRAEAFEIGTGFSHLVVEVASLDAVLARLAAAGITAEPAQLPGGPDGPRTSFVFDPDGWRIELVQWQAGHGHGMTSADFR